MIRPENVLAGRIFLASAADALGLPLMAGPQDEYRPHQGRLFPSDIEEEGTAWLSAKMVGVFR